MLNKSFKYFIIYILYTLLASGCGQYHADIKNLGNEPNNKASTTTEILPEESLIIPDNVKLAQPKLDISYELKTFDTEIDAASLAANIAINQAHLPRTTLVISSDSVKFIEEIYRNKNFEKLNSGSTVVIYNNALERFAKSSTEYIKNAYTTDKIGFVIAIYTTAVETMMWIHVAPLSVIEKSATVVYTIGLALYYKLNKDRWSEHTQIIKKPLLKFFNETGELTKLQKIKYDFLANFGLATAISFARIPLLSMTQIIDTGLSLNLFKMPLLLSIVATASFFSWTEHQGSIDKNTHPISKFVFRRTSELRSVLLATFASTAALLNPAVFGIAPWVTIAAMGAVGLNIYLNSEQINNWIEKSPYFKKIEKLIKYNSDMQISCRQLITN